MSETQPPPTASSTLARSNQPAPNSPPVSISSGCHLDPASYVKGSHLLTIEQNAVIHPRCRLYTDQGPITIHEGCIFNERCILGIDKELNPPLPSSLDLEEDDPRQIVVGPNTYFSSSVKIQPPCVIGEAVILEAGVTLSPGCRIGSHAKICAGVKIPSETKIPDWTVVYGINGSIRRQRKDDIFEKSRLDGMAKERAGAEALLKLSSTKTSNTSSSRKRDSILTQKVESQKS